MLIGYGTVSAGQQIGILIAPMIRTLAPARSHVRRTNRRGFHFDVSERRRATAQMRGQPFPVCANGNRGGDNKWLPPTPNISP